MQRNKLHILLLLVLSALLPATLWAKKRGMGEESSAILTLDEQHYFDSIYFLAITQNQCDRADSSIVLMRQAVAFYDSVIEAQGMHVNIVMPTELDNSSKIKKKDKQAKPSPTSRQVPGLAAAYYFLSKRFREQNDAMQTLINIESAVAIDSVNYWFTEEEGSLFMALKQYDEARVCFERLVRQYPEKVDPLYSMSEIYFRLDSIDLGLKSLNRIEELEGVNPQLTQYKFGILQSAGRTEEAFNEYGKLIERYPYNVRYRINLGDLQMQNGQIHQAKKTYESASAIEPDNAYVWVAEANYFSMIGDQQSADSLVAAALVNVNLDVETKGKIMEEYLRGSFRKLSVYRDEISKGNISSELDTMQLFSNVDSLFSHVVGLHPTADQIYELQYEWRAAMGQDSLASESMRYAVNLKPTSQDYWGHLLAHSTRWMPKSDVIALTHEALEQDSTLQIAYSVAAWAYIQMKEYEKAIEQNLLAIDHMSPPDANQVSSLWGSIGDLYHEMGEMDKVYDCYDKAVKYNPSNYNVLNNYAYYLSESGKELTKAEQMSLKVIQKEPNNSTYLDTYAWILYLEGSYSLAIFYQQQAIDNLPAGDEGNCTLFDHYGDMLVKNNDLKGAAEKWRHALDCKDCSDEDRVLIQKKIESAEILLK